MRIHGYVVVLSRLLGLVDCMVGVGLVLFPSSILSVFELNPTTLLVLLARLIGVIMFAMGNLYCFGLMQSRREESYEPLRQVWLVTGCFRVCTAFVVGGLVFSQGAAAGGVISTLLSALIGGWQVLVILTGRFPRICESTGLSR